MGKMSIELANVQISESVFFMRRSVHLYKKNAVGQRTFLLSQNRLRKQPKIETVMYIGIYVQNPKAFTHIKTFRSSCPLRKFIKKKSTGEFTTTRSTLSDLETNKVFSE